jgi:hypothetical protein
VIRECVRAEKEKKEEKVVNVKKQVNGWEGGKWG